MSAVALSARSGEPTMYSRERGVAATVSPTISLHATYAIERGGIGTRL